MFLASSCNGDESQQELQIKKSYTVTLNSTEGTLSVNKIITAEYNAKISEPSEPINTREYTFSGWYTTNETRLQLNNIIC